MQRFGHQTFIKDKPIKKSYCGVNILKNVYDS
jgi:hypothetical protein